MSDRGHHCPFLNRADTRCSTNFSLDQLDQAFDVCCGAFAQCPVFAELSAERRARRAAKAANPGFPTYWASTEGEAARAQGPYVRVTLSHRDPKLAAGTQGAAAAPGL